MPVYVSFLLLFADERLLAQAAAPGDVSDENPFVPFVPVLVSLHVVEHLSPEVTRVDRVGVETPDDQFEENTETVRLIDGHRCVY